ncbi:MAG: hypothetical protein WCY27_02255 [archaeon]|jgi:hypothetical protein|nr:hypothetical protein [archaeon]MDD2477560.1 hypothetical protein [Candidatus ainarchaeum sp.]MDD3084344.1 hypothetical protein [Candidatus ainarchaeum sp.]MDD4221086.1 hypothetical protein [Candidatus ainarchaeum sp.]MDD4662557.1 hypothetical protein [Candidatus ainarchaeum sp.]
MPPRKPNNKSKKPVGKTYSTKLRLQDVPDAVKFGDRETNRKIVRAFRRLTKKKIDTSKK